MLSKFKSDIMKKILSLLVFCCGFYTQVIAQEDTASAKQEKAKQKFTRSSNTDFSPDAEMRSEEFKSDIMNFLKFW